MWDGLGTLAIGILLVMISIVLTAEMKSLLIGEAATEEHLAALLSAISGVEEVESALRGAVPLTMQIYLEPDLFDPTREEAH